MLRIGELAKWTMLREGEGMAFVNSRPRNVRLEVNAPAEAALYVVSDGKTRFLALVKGKETVEFGVSGKFTLTVEGAAVYVYTADGMDIHSVVLDPVIFTKIVERRRRNPELEMMQWEAQINIERRMAVMAAEIEARYAARLAEQQQNVDTGTGTASTDTSEPASTGDEASSAASSETAA